MFKKINQSNKKTQFFLIDGLFALVILILGYLLLYSNNKGEIDNINIEIYSNNIFSVFTNIKGEDLCNQGSCNLLYPNIISNINQSLMNILGELYYKNQKPNAVRLINDSIKNYDLIDDKLGLKIFINNEEIFSIGSNFEKAQEKINRQSVIFGFYENKEEGDLIKYGPYLFEVLVWNEK